MFVVITSWSVEGMGSILNMTVNWYVGIKNGLQIWLLSEKDASGVLLNDVSHHNGVPVCCASYSPDEQRIISGDWNGIVKVPIPQITCNNNRVIIRP